MPMYEYRCKTGHRFEKIRQILDADAPIACPDCGEPSGRLLSLIAARPKSGGLAMLDYPSMDGGGGGCCGGACGCSN